MAYWEICLSHHVHGTLSLFDVQLLNLARGGDVLMGWNCHLSNSLGWGPGMPPSVPHEHQVNRLTYSRTVILKCMSGAVLKGVPGAAPAHSKVWPPVQPPPIEVHHADILTEVYAIASLGLQAQVCH